MLLVSLPSSAAALTIGPGGAGQHDPVMALSGGDLGATRPDMAPSAVEANVPMDTGATTTTTTTNATTLGVAEEGGPLGDFSASLTYGIDIGTGSFLSGDARQSQVVSTWWPTLAYKLADGISLAASFVMYQYHVNDFATPYEEGKVLWTDPYIGITHGKVFSDKDLGVTINASLRLYLPLSESSQFQNRLLSIRPGVGARWTLGPVSLVYSLAFMKYFARTSVPSLDCDEFDAGQCLEGRGPDVAGGYVSERQGGEVFLPSVGSYSFYVLNSLGLSVEPLEGLSIGVSAAVYNLFGVKVYGDDELTPVNSTPGERSQVDRLVTQISIDYQIIKQLAVGVSVGTDAVNPFGARGDDLVTVFSELGGERAADNITSLSFSVTGSL